MFSAGVIVAVTTKGDNVDVLYAPALIGKLRVFSSHTSLYISNHGFLDALSSLCLQDSIFR